jgi:preprotein translocase subunit SecD
LTIPPTTLYNAPVFTNSIILTVEAIAAVRSREATFLILILIVAGLALWIDFAPGDNWLGRDVRTRLGLDLQGGTQVLLKAQRAVSSDEMQTALGVINRRVNGLGVSEAVVQRSGSDRIVVELPGVRDPEEAISTLRGAGQLEFIDSQGQYLPVGQVVRTSANPKPPASKPTSTLTSTNSLTNTESVTSTGSVSPTVSGPIYPSITNGRDLDTSQVAPRFGGTQTPGRNQYAVTFAFTGNSATQLADFTSKNVGKPMCIVLDNRVQSCPVIQSALVNGSGDITTATQQDAQNIYNQLKFGALPVSFDVESNRTVSATLGQDSVSLSIVAGVVGLVVVGLFMLLYYRLPGLLATIALLIYTAITFAFYRLIPITLTLAGIAGFILSIGLAVDANVLIFARLKEELRRGKSLRAAVEAGFDEAWPAIRDSNASTLITSAILYFFGNSFGVSIIKGFALTLGLGIIISLFTAITVTRTFLRLIVPLQIAQNPWMFELEEAAGLDREREALA